MSLQPVTRLGPPGSRPPPLGTRQQQRSAQRYRSRRANAGPGYGRFGMPTHVDSRGREYRPTQEPLVMLCRHRIHRRRRPQQIGGSEQPTDTEPGPTFDQRPAGSSLPRWPRPDQELLLFRIRDQVLQGGKVDRVLTLPRGATARIILQDPPGLYTASEGGGPVADPAPYLAWIPRSGASTGSSASGAPGSLPDAESESI